MTRIYTEVTTPEIVGTIDATETTPGVWDIHVRDFTDGSHHTATIQQATNEPFAVIAAGLTAALNLEPAT